MSNIDPKYRIPLQGKYNSGIYTCNHCGCEILFGDKDYGSLYDHIIGFNDSPIGMVAIYECPECFEKFYCHNGYGKLTSYMYFLESIEYGTQRHYTK